MLLAKVFRGLRERGVSPHEVGRQLLLDSSELNSLLFRLVVTALPMTPA